jgi:hypothetical protein
MFDKTKKSGKRDFGEDDVDAQVEEVSQALVDAQKVVDSKLLPHVKATPHMVEYLKSKFRVTDGMRVHELKF